MLLIPFSLCCPYRGTASIQCKLLLTAPASTHIRRSSLPVPRGYSRWLQWPRKFSWTSPPFCTQQQYPFQISCMPSSLSCSLLLQFLPARDFSQLLSTGGCSTLMCSVYSLWMWVWGMGAGDWTGVLVLPAWHETLSSHLHWCLVIWSLGTRGLSFNSHDLFRGFVKYINISNKHTTFDRAI